MGRPKLTARTGSKEAYKLFKEKYPNSPLTCIQYIRILHKFNELLTTHIMETGDKVKLPWGLGPITIVKKKQTTFFEKDGKKYTTLSVDWKTTKELGFKVYLMNSHTSGFRYKWWWSPKESRLFQSHIWIFKPCRKISRQLATYLLKPNSEYKDIYRIDIKKR